MPSYTCTTYSSINDIDNRVFKALDCEETVYFSKPFLQAFERANTLITYTYLIITLDNKPVALAITQAIDISLETATEKLPLTQQLARSLQCYLSGKKTHILVCGNIFLSGAYGLYVKTGIDKRRIYNTLSRKLKKLSTPKKPRIFFLKDFNAQEDASASIAEKEHFQSFTVEPNMRLVVRWQDFETYKASLKSKYRVKVNRADTLSKHLISTSFTATQIRDNIHKLQGLYNNVVSKAVFNTVPIAIETYALLKGAFKDQVRFTAYSKDGELVGFSTAFIVNDVLEAHFIGLDYDFNKTDAIYQRMLNDYIRQGLSLGVKEINLGRTASEIKSTLGATPEQLRCYIKHRRTVANMLFKPFVRQIKMTEYKQHTPFKN
ncbi:GNAT family N-acetyltransferase [uncultured Dokdonia sp.]|uniref:GNAT family N-acetyltransferase n=1 Tax=uncultured Dokdonia sp. TaxID=575653 RepID=UPI0026041C00|nr:GNAT family N-acetyltransferase [uncultured Dokdonia sp.]